MAVGQGTVCLQSQHSRGTKQQNSVLKASPSSTMTAVSERQKTITTYSGVSRVGALTSSTLPHQTVLILVRSEEFLSFILFSWTKTGPLLFNKHPPKTIPTSFFHTSTKLWIPTFLCRSLKGKSGEKLHDSDT